MDIDDGKAAATDRRLKGRGWRLADLDYFRHPHEAFSAFVLVMLTLFAIWLIYVFASAMWTLIAGLGDPKAASENAKNLLLTVGASVAAPFVVWRTWIAHQQWQVGVGQAKTQTETLQTGLLTKAIEQLGAMREEKLAFRTDDGKWETRTETVPNIEVRLGAIYLLKRLAEDNDRDHGPILETLCAYVRENSRQEWKKWSREEAKRRGQVTASGEDIQFIEPMESSVVDAFATRDYEKIDEWRKRKSSPREDIQSALRVIGDRNLADQRRSLDIKCNLSLAGSFLVGAQLQNITLRGIDFSNAHCQEANFSASEIVSVHFVGTHLEGANFMKTKCRALGFYSASCQGAVFEMANLRQVAFYGSELQSTSFIDAQCQCSLFGQSNCQSSDFSLAKLQGSTFRAANLAGASFGEADLYCVDFSSADLSGAKGVATRTLASAFGGPYTKLPADVERPAPGQNWIPDTRDNKTPSARRDREAFIEEQQKQILAELIAQD